MSHGWATGPRKLWTALRLLTRRARGDRHGAGFTLMTRAGRVLYPEYRFTDRPLSWSSDPELERFLERFGDANAFNSHRRWMLAQLLRLCAGVEGDTVECGVFRGATSWLICAANVGSDKVHHVFDSFQGLSDPGSEDGAFWEAGALSVSRADVEANLAEFSAVRFYAGWIPARFPEVEERSFSFVHVDVDLEQPTLDSVAFFYPRLNPGGILLCDDYGFETCPGATEAVDTFLADKPEKMLSLPQGGGFLVKGTPTGPTVFRSAAPPA